MSATVHKYGLKFGKISRKDLLCMKREYFYIQCSASYPKGIKLSFWDCYILGDPRATSRDDVIFSVRKFTEVDFRITWS